MIGAVLRIVLQFLIGGDPGQRIGLVLLGLEVVVRSSSLARKLVDAGLWSASSCFSSARAASICACSASRLALHRGAFLVALDQSAQRRSAACGLRAVRRAWRRTARVRLRARLRWRLERLLLALGEFVARADARRGRCWSATASGRTPRRSCRRCSAGRFARSARFRRADRFRARSVFICCSIRRARRRADPARGLLQRVSQHRFELGDAGALRSISASSWDSNCSIFSKIGWLAATRSRSIFSLMVSEKIASSRNIAITQASPSDIASRIATRRTATPIASPRRRSACRCRLPQRALREPVRLAQRAVEHQNRQRDDQRDHSRIQTLSIM